MKTFGIATTMLVLTLGSALGAQDLDAVALDNEEIQDLLFMREEEKLARDVYLALGDRWSLRVFDNIAASEQQHTDRIADLLDFYGIPDPASAERGVFTDPVLADLYEDLVDQGSTSMTAALEVGKAIEELDIADLEEAMAKTDEADIRLVYEQLLRGSENHLAAFERQLRR